MTRPGAEGEATAARLLRRRGYRLLEQNYRCPLGEIDIVAEQRGVLCFVEVKSRTNLSFGDPAEAVDRRKQRQIARVARHYLQTHPRTQDAVCRFDVVTVRPGQVPELITHAFQIED